MCVCLTQEEEKAEVGDPSQVISLDFRGLWCYCVDMSESSGPAARRRVMRAAPVQRCLFRGHQEASN